MVGKGGAGGDRVVTYGFCGPSDLLDPPFKKHDNRSALDVNSIECRVETTCQQPIECALDSCRCALNNVIAAGGNTAERPSRQQIQHVQTIRLKLLLVSAARLTPSRVDL